MNILMLMVAIYLLPFTIVSAQTYDYTVSLDFGMELQWTVDSSRVSIQICAPARGWVGVGFAQNPKRMIPSRVIVGWASDTASNVQEYEVSAKKVESFKAMGTGTLSSYAAIKRNGKTCVSFVRAVTHPLWSLNLSDTQNMIFAYHETNDKLGKHTHRVFATIMLTTSELSQVGSSSHSDGIYRSHAILMIVSMLLFSLGIVIPSAKRWIGPVWLRLHKVMQIIGFILFCTSAGMAIHTSDTTLFTSTSGHGVFGRVILLFLILQFIGTFFQPHIEHPRRHMWQITHRLAALTIIMCMAVNTLVGPLEYQERYGESNYFALAATILSLIILFCNGIAYVVVVPARSPKRGILPQGPIIQSMDIST